MSNTLKLGNGKWATGKDTLLAYNDENNNFKPLPFSFSRASSGTVVNEQGLIELVGSDEPRIDFKDDAKGSLLLEPQRSNLIVNSQSLSLTPIKNGTFTDNFAISPDGTQNASKFTAPNSDPYFYQSVSFSASSYTASIYVKGIGSSIGKDFRIVLGAESTNPKLIIPSEWTRFEYTVTMPSGSYNAGLEIADPAVVGDEVLIWGWQVEQGSYATSYIPTNGQANGVTRVGDGSSQTVPDGVIGQTEGSVFLEIKAPNELADGGRTIFVIGDGPNTVYISKNSSTLNTFQLATQSPSGFNFINTSEITTDKVKLAIGYKNGDNAFYVNGSLISSESAATNPSLNSELLLGNSTASLNTDVRIKDFKLYNTRLSNSELAALTS